MKPYTGLACVLSAALVPVPTQANTIIVDGSSCTLQDAITAANTDTASGGCASGGGADILTMTADIILNDVNNDTDGPNGLPSVTSRLKLSGQGHVLSRSLLNGTPDFRIFHVSESGDLTIKKLDLERGSQGNTGLDGGGILNKGRLTVKSSQVSNNTGQDGGGICNILGTVNIIDSRIENNASWAFGGGVFNAGGTVTADKSTIAGNNASDSGGGFASVGELYRVPAGTLALSDSTLSNNSALIGGGVYIADEANVHLTNSTISGNHATGIGGFLFESPGQVTLTSVTFSENRDTRGVSGGFYGRHGVSVTLDNTLIANSVSTCDSCQIKMAKTDCVLEDGTMNAKGVNLIENDVSCDASDFPAGTDPKLGPLANNGGATKTHALLAGSQAINPAVCDIATDERGISRPQPVGGQCDIGAFERIPLDAVLNVYDNKQLKGKLIGTGKDQAIRKQHAKTYRGALAASINYLSKNDIVKTCGELNKAVTWLDRDGIIKATELVTGRGPTKLYQTIASKRARYGCS